MRAVVLKGHGGMDMLEYRDDWPTPQPATGEVLVKVHACGMNNTDINTRSGWYSRALSAATTGRGYSEVDEIDPTWGGAPLEFPRIQGADMVGVVVATGEGVEDGLVGRRVMADCWIRNWDDPEGMEGVGYFGSERDGGYADYSTIDARQVVPVESDWSSAELATLSCSYTTAENLLNRVGCKEGDRVLITGASGGVGSALIQLANRRGAQTIAMASESKHAAVAELKPAAILQRNPEDLRGAIREATGHDNVTVIADIVGGSFFPALIEVLERGGRYGTSGAIAGPLVDLDLRTLYLRDLTFHGCTITGLNVFPDLVGYVERNEIRPVLAATYPLEEFHAAQKAFIDKKQTGNIVVTMESSK
ncbi:MAG: alcohol dehydrogenase family protein [Gammaproteobacteria bacterium]|nr:alcohol dehydrogenase family protein [Gammaproteobacteria bacterium]